MTTFEKEIFGNAKCIEDKLLQYGFTKTSDIYVYKCGIFNNEFTLIVEINNSSEVNTSLIENSFKEPYIIYKVPTSQGEFVGKIKKEVSLILEDIKNKCFISSIAISIQTKDVIQYVKDKYGDEPEYLWEKFKETAAIRKKDNKKWYGLICKIPANKLNINNDNLIDVLIVRGDPIEIDNQNIFAGWHMNKKSWISLVLDNRLSNEEVFKIIDKSYLKAK